MCLVTFFYDWRRDKTVVWGGKHYSLRLLSHKAQPLCIVFLLYFISRVFNMSFLTLQTQLIQMVIWMLQHRLLIQLHTYVCLMVPPNEEDFRAQDEDMPFTARVGGRSLSTPNALSFGSPSMSPLFSAVQTAAHCWSCR